MSRDWVPAGSVPYQTALASDVRPRHHGDVAAESVPYFGTVPFKGPRKRNPKKCWGNDNKCEGFKSAGTNYCAGHQKAIAKKAAEVNVDGGEDEG